MDGFVDTPQGPYRSSEAVDVSAADHQFSRTTGGIYVGVAGVLVLRLEGDDHDSVWTVGGGSYHPLRATHVRRANTTASQIQGLL